MTYANVVYSYGAERFIATCRDIGVQGLILPDIPYEEKEEFLDLCHEYGVELVSLVAPTSANRIAMIAKEAEGFLYIVSSLGVTGTRTEISTDLDAIVKHGHPLCHRLRHLDAGTGGKDGRHCGRSHRRLGDRQTGGRIRQRRRRSRWRLCEVHERSSQELLREPVEQTALSMVYSEQFSI